MKTAKQEYLDNEADAWFERNLSALEKRKVSIGTTFFEDFYKRFNENNSTVQGGVLEIGSSFGYNLAWLSEHFPNINYSAIEPSRKAIAYGSEKYAELIKKGKLTFTRGTADNLPFSDESFDCILIGFCMYQADRNLLGKIASEIDRCLRYGGFLVITDFDVFFNEKRTNIHNSLTPTYKANYAKLFEGIYGYTLVEKTTYNADSTELRSFPTEVSNRVSTQILYKEFEKDVYLSK